MKPFGVIYKATSRTSGKSYVGLTSTTLEDRWGRHVDAAQKGQKRKLPAAIRKYGADDFQLEVIDRADTKEILYALEICWIGMLMTRHNGYNMTRGGDGRHGAVASPETRAKMSASLKGEKNPMFGKRPSPEHLAKIAATSKGRKHSAETRARISEGNKGRILSDEVRAKISAAHKGKTHTDEAKSKMSASQKRRFAKQ